MASIEQMIEDNPELGGLWAAPGQTPKIVKLTGGVRVAWTEKYLLTEIGGEAGAIKVAEAPFI